MSVVMQDKQAFQETKHSLCNTTYSRQHCTLKPNQKCCFIPNFLNGFQTNIQRQEPTKHYKHVQPQTDDASQERHLQGKQGDTYHETGRSCLRHTPVEMGSSSYNCHTPSQRSRHLAVNSSQDAANTQHDSAYTHVKLKHLANNCWFKFCT